MGPREDRQWHPARDPPLCPWCVSGEYGCLSEVGTEAQRMLEAPACYVPECAALFGAPDLPLLCFYFLRWADCAVQSDLQFVTSCLSFLNAGTVGP